VEELGVTRAVEREDTDQDRHGRAAGLLEETVELGEVVHRLGLHPAGSRLHLAVEAVDLPGDVLGRRVQAAPT